LLLACSTDADRGAAGRKSNRLRAPDADAQSSRPAMTSNPTQSFYTDGLDVLAPLSLPARALMRVMNWVERLNLRFSKVGNPCVYDNALFPWVAEIEREWPLIRAELDRLLVRKADLPSFHEIAPDVATISRDTGWKTFLLTGYGLHSEQNVKLCPETWRVVQKIPGLITAMFSIFEPDKYLKPHRGPYNGVLRLHLGLLVPEPRDQVAIRVGNDVCHWEEGRALIFDDAYEHEAWNRTARPRVVLFVDFVKPLRFPANLINWLVLHLAVFTPYIREGLENHRSWERRFYADAKRGM
jgi:aspartyl/asparaginyl beta-hydroxylase (cupin superfamily)